MKTSRIFSVILCIALLLTTVVGVMPITASAAETDDDTASVKITEKDDDLAETGDQPVEEINNWDALWHAMTGNGIRLMKLTGDVNAKMNPAYNEMGVQDPLPYAIVLGKQRKRLDLNGFHINVSFDDYQQSSTLFQLNEGTELEITDSTHTNNGGITYDGYIPSYDEHYRPMSMDLITPQQNRDIFEINGGSLTINAGTYTAGRSKAETFGAKEFDKILNGTVAELNSGKLIINNGVFTGRGCEKIYFLGKIRGQGRDEKIAEAIEKGQLKGEWNNYLDKNGIIEASSGTLIVNNGAFYAKSSADAFQIDDFVYDKSEDRVDATVRNCDIYFHRNGRDTNFLWDLTEDSDGEIPNRSNFGDLGLNEDIVDTTITQYRFSQTLPEDVIFPYGKDGNEDKNPLTQWRKYSLFENPEIHFFPRKDREMTITDKDSLQPVDFLYYWDKSKGDRAIEVDPIRYFAGGTDYQKTEIMDLEIRDSAATSPTVKDKNGNIIWAGGEFEDPILKVRRVLNKDNETGRYTFNLSETISGIEDKLYGSYSVNICFFETISVNGAPVTLVSYKDFCVVFSECNITITQQPAKSMHVENGTSVNLSATATNSEQIWWVQTYPTSRVLKENVDYFNNGNNSILIYNMNGVASRFKCFFKNKTGVVGTDEAAVYLKPKFTRSGIIDCTAYSGMNSFRLTASLEDYKNCGSITGFAWYKDGVDMKLGTQEGRVNYPKLGLASGAGISNLTFVGPSGQAGDYQCRVRYMTANGIQEVEGPTFRLTVKDGLPKGAITKVDMNGFNDLYVGAPAPTKDNIYCSDPRLTVSAVEWIGVYNGRIDNPNPTVTIKLLANNPNGYENYFYSASGDFPWSMDGVGHIAYKEANYSRPYIELTYTYDNHHPLYHPYDTVELEHYVFTVHEDETVNIPINYTYKCPTQHATKHQCTKVEFNSSEIVTADGTANALPAGLSITDDGRIVGTVTAAASEKPYEAYLKFCNNGTDSVNSLIFINVVKKHETNSLLNFDPDKMHEHELSPWKSDGVATHSRHCTTAGCAYTEQEAHHWEDHYEVIVKATPEHDGTAKYTCHDCGATMTMPYKYEEESSITLKLGDTDGDGEVTILDATVIQRQLAELTTKEYFEQAADADGDGDVTILDATAIQRYLADLSHNANIGKYI